jgi:hypothetical protein
VKFVPPACDRQDPAAAFNFSRLKLPPAADRVQHLSKPAADGVQRDDAGAW